MSFGLGLVVSGLSFKIYYKSIRDRNIEKEARGLGMVYPDEVKVRGLLRGE